MNKHIVTKDTLLALLNNCEKMRPHVIGRALVVLFERQTAAEQDQNATTQHNAIGFTGADGYSGCLTAKFYIKHKTLLDWQIDRWMKVGKSGYPRICKYWKQLDEAAQAKAKLTATNS